MAVAAVVAMAQAVAATAADLSHYDHVLIVIINTLLSPSSLFKKTLTSLSDQAYKSAHSHTTTTTTTRTTNRLCHTDINSNLTQR